MAHFSARCYSKQPHGNVINNIFLFFCYFKNVILKKCVFQSVEFFNFFKAIFLLFNQINYFTKEIFLYLFLENNKENSAEKI